ncbi:hypothetical protein JB92DRAFT_119895 [Gautieria morchelliformis]|nr:hypothetical protein JB92DRAFT_119895 [Gautieria morchelliformis]
MASAPPSISQDASSLRAAALLTLKSKTKPRYHPPSRVDRPSPDDASSVASTRRAAQSPELNYGSDDGLADAEGSTEEDGEGEKEEGEISDDEAGAGVKASPMLMDIDNEPLPGLTASSITPRSSEDASGLRHRGHNTPPTSLVPTAPKAVTLSTSVNSDSATSGPRSSTIVPDHPSITSSAASAAAKPTSHGAPAVEVGSRSSNRSPVTKIPTPPPRTSSSSNKPSLSFTSDATSRFITPRIPHRDADRRATDPVPNLERSKANRHTSPSPPVFSRQVNSKPSLSTLASLDNTHVRPSLSSELFS